MSDIERYTFDPPADLTIKDVADLFRVFAIEVDRSMYLNAPENVKRLFKPSIMSPSPSRMLN